MKITRCDNERDHHGTRKGTGKDQVGIQQGQAKQDLLGTLQESRSRDIADNGWTIMDKARTTKGAHRKHIGTMIGLDR